MSSNGQSALAILVRAKQYIQGHGWIQREYGKDGGPRCMVGALLSAVGNGPGDLGLCGNGGLARDRLLGAIRARTPGLSRYVSLPAWNDSHSRTINQVLAAFDWAIYDEAQKRKANGRE